MTQLETLIQQARSWIDQDPDAETVAELEQLIADSNEAALIERFGQRIGFGTAGLRGLLGAGRPECCHRLRRQKELGCLRQRLSSDFCGLWNKGSSFS